jgi:hypothetical protein
MPVLDALIAAIQATRIEVIDLTATPPPVLW